MIEYIKHIDTEVFLFLNGLHHSFLDLFMYWISEKTVWIPLYIFLFYFVIKYNKRKSIWILIALIILIILSDQISVFIKNSTERIRPCHEPALKDLIHLVKNKCGGQFSFFSSHASNHFSLAVFLSLLFKNNSKYFTLPLLLWASLISYSRIYLGKHYPTDVIAGAIAGTLLAILIFYLLKIIYLKINQKQLFTDRT